MSKARSAITLAPCFDLVNQILCPLEKVEIFSWLLRNCSFLAFGGVSNGAQGSLPLVFEQPYDAGNETQGFTKATQCSTTEPYARLLEIFFLEEVGAY